MAAPAPASPNEPKATAEDAKSGAKSEAQDEPREENATEQGKSDPVTAPTAAVPLTYANTKNSEAYLTSKTKLNEGDFEGALENIETALKTTLSLLPDADELHESLAPLYYMYGTTLLYSVEESPDNAESAVMVQQQQDEGGGGSPNDNAEDLQIAWENLDTARAIVNRITTSAHFAKSSSTDPADAEGRDLVLDLAQIHVRLGDLQRANGNYGPALADFRRALDIRTKALGRYDRRVADTTYRLGATCVALAAEGEKVRQQAAQRGGSAAAQERLPDRPPELTAAQIAEYKVNAVAHYLSCGRSLGGIVGKMCGENPDAIASVPSDDGAAADGDDSDSDDDGKTSEKGKGKAKASPPSPDAAKPSPPTTSIFSSFSTALKAICDRVSDLQPTDPQDGDAVSDLRELLDEIQEAIDTAEEDLKGLSDVSSMKAKAEADIDAADQAALEQGLEASRAEVSGDEAGVTTVGFGAGTSSSAATTAAPMMVVKKKKKKRDDEGEGKDDTKRAKTE